MSYRSDGYHARMALTDAELGRLLVDTESDLVERKAALTGKGQGLRSDLRLRERSAGSPAGKPFVTAPGAGAINGLAATGGVITSAGAVAGRPVAVSPLPPWSGSFTEIGFAVAVGVMHEFTIIVRSVLVTALTLDIGRFMWWPSRLAGRSDRKRRAPSRRRWPPVRWWRAGRDYRCRVHRGPDGRPARLPVRQATAIKQPPDRAGQPEQEDRRGPPGPARSCADHSSGRLTAHPAEARWK